MKSLADSYAVPAAEMTNAFEHVFVEPTGKVNLLAGWEEGEITLVSQRFHLLASMLTSRSCDPRREVRWQCYRIPASIALIKCFWNHCSPALFDSTTR
jgi:hypothetical protein